MSWFEAMYGRPGHGVGPGEPEKKGLARYAQMVGRDLGQLLGANLLTGLLVLPAALGVSLGVTLQQLPLTLGLGALTGLLAGPGALLLADCALRSLQNDPAPWLPRARRALAARWRVACGFGAAATALLGAVAFVFVFVYEAAVQQGYYAGAPVVVFLALDLLVLAVGATLCIALLPVAGRGGLLRGALGLLLASPARCVGAGAVLLAGVGGIVLLFPVSVFWAVVFGFWVPGLAAMQLLFPALRAACGLTVAPAARPASTGPKTARQQRAASRANWWYYHWGVVAVCAVVATGAMYAAHGLLTTVDPDCTVALVTAEALPDEAAARLGEQLAPYAGDLNGDGAAIVEVRNYTWSAHAALTDQASQMAGATQMNTDLANHESVLWILEDPDGFEQAYGALSEQLGPDWRAALIPWDGQPVLARLELGSYATTADGSETQDIQQRLADCTVAVFQPDSPLWQKLSQ